MWQAVWQELHERGLQVITVALDSGGAEAAGPWIRRAQPAHPSLIDVRHEVADRYQMVNVPTTVWIDEVGQMVRPNEHGWAGDHFRLMRDPANRAHLVETAKARRDRYVEAVRDWVAHGSASRYALASEEARRRMAAPDDRHAEAAAWFRLGEYVHARGHAADAVAHFKRAHDLWPESWSLRRQAWALGDAERDYGTSFWAEVDALGDRPYYPETEIPAGR